MPAQKVLQSRKPLSSKAAETAVAELKAREHAEYQHSLLQGFDGTPMIDVGDPDREKPPGREMSAAYVLTRGKPGHSLPPVLAVPVALGPHRYTTFPWCVGSGAQGQAGMEGIFIECGMEWVPPTEEFGHARILRPTEKSDVWTWFNYTPGVILSNDAEMIKKLEAAMKDPAHYLSTWVKGAIYVDSPSPVPSPAL